MGKRLINVDEVEEIIPVLVGKLLENNLITEKQADQIIRAIFNDNCLGEYGERDVHQDVETMANEEYNKWLILYFDMQSINLQFNCNDIASSLKAQRDKIKQFCIDCLTGVKHQADSFLFDTNACSIRYITYSNYRSLQLQVSFHSIRSLSKSVSSRSCLLSFT